MRNNKNWAVIAADCIAIMVLMGFFIRAIMSANDLASNYEPSISFDMTLEPPLNYETGEVSLLNLQ